MINTLAFLAGCFLGVLACAALLDRTVERIRDGYPTRAWAITRMPGVSRGRLRAMRRELKRSIAGRR